VGERLPLEERQAIVEKLLRQLQPHEMEGFVDFLPWIWGDDKLSHTAKLYAALEERDRARAIRMVELGTIEPAGRGSPPSAAAAAVPAAAAPEPAPTPAAATPAAVPPPKRAMAEAGTQTEPPESGEAGKSGKPPPRELGVGDLMPWRGFSPTEGGKPYTLEQFLEASADCYEAALQSMLGGALKRANWAKAVFHMLLKRAGDAKKGKKKEEARPAPQARGRRPPPPPLRPKAARGTPGQQRPTDRRRCPVPTRACVSGSSPQRVRRSPPVARAPPPRLPAR
jgi:hypothetical protein